MKKAHFLMPATLIACIFFLTSFFIPQEQKQPAPWDIPAEYEKKVNPYDEYNKDMQRLGKILWSKHCKSCHGSKGKGDGPKARELDTFPGDLTLKAFNDQSDGAIYYKSFIGRDEMPNYEKKITDEEERWALVFYQRNMKP